MDIDPKPNGLNDHIDLEGNRVTQAWFSGTTDTLEVDVSMGVETLRSDPFGFILDPDAVRLPDSTREQGAGPGCYLRRHRDGAVDAWAATLRAEAGEDRLAFLGRLNRLLFEQFETEIRERGGPRRPARTLAERRGACRDLAVLFVDCCRFAGVAARFASGYQRGEARRERRFLHAWPEVYLPGAGWRGFDPTHGSVVADAHVTIAAAADPADTLPIRGSFVADGDVESELDFEIGIEVSSD